MTGSILDGMRAFASLLEKAKTVVLTGHERADGDVIGTMAALHHRLRRGGREVVPFLFEPVPSRYAFLAFDNHARVFDSEDPSHRAVVEGADVVVIIDASSEDRMPGWEALLPRRRGVLVRFDHHPTSHPGSADISLVDEKACATGQIVCDFLRLTGDRLSREEALGIFVAIATDTGWFRYSNTTPAAMLLAAELLETGINPSEIYRSVYQTNKLELIRLAGRVLATAREEMDGRLLWALIDRGLVNEYGLGGELETDILLDLLRSTKNSICVALFRELEGGKIRVNLRSKGGIAVNKVAEMFGGGGHLNAAGITMKGMLPEDCARVVVGALKKNLPDASKQQ